MSMSMSRAQRQAKNKMMKIDVLLLGFHLEQEYDFEILTCFAIHTNLIL